MLVEAIVSYDVKKLLVDASNSSTNLSEEDNRQLSLELAAELAKSRLRKMARIQPKLQESEEVAQENIKRIKQAGLLSYELQTFSSRDEALEWLQK